jgi:hypothetical protein
MRDTIKRLQPESRQAETSGRWRTSLDVGKLTRIEGGGYKLEGGIFATSDADRGGIHNVMDQLMERLDQALEDAKSTQATTH